MTTSALVITPHGRRPWCQWCQAAVGLHEPVDDDEAELMEMSHQRAYHRDHVRNGHRNHPSRWEP